MSSVRKEIVLRTSSVHRGDRSNDELRSMLISWSYST